LLFYFSYQLRKGSAALHGCLLTVITLCRYLVKRSFKTLYCYIHRCIIAVVVMLLFVAIKKGPGGAGTLFL